ncbi:TPA: hypothetical protein DEP94_00020 [Candidatus Nomurabacteria bacterium]|nr:hypothetical protein [Candidatus Nomurabacteria bacterium]
MNTIKILGIVLLSIFGSTYFTFASIDKNLKYGQRNNEVMELQEFLIDKGFLKTTPTNFFGLLTLKAVKSYQANTGVSPTGFVGVLTREKINNEIALELASSNEAEIKETGTIEQTKLITTLDVCKNIEGIQTNAPSGMFLDNLGSCFSQTTNPQPVTQVTNSNTGTVSNTQTNSTPNLPSTQTSSSPIWKEVNFDTPYGWCGQQNRETYHSFYCSNINPGEKFILTINGFSPFTFIVDRVNGKYRDYSFGPEPGTLKSDTEYNYELRYEMPDKNLYAIKKGSFKTCRSTPCE